MLCVIQLNACTLIWVNTATGLTVVGDGEPIVCFHGFSESSYTWDAINLPGYRVIRIDLIGHGDFRYS